MLPKIMELELPNIETNESDQPLGRSYLFDFNTGDFVLQDGKLVVADETTALKIWIEKALRTELDLYEIYEGTGYGIGIDDLKGYSLPYSFVESEIRREVTDTLTQHPKIQNVAEFVVERDKSLLKVSFRVISEEDNSFSQEVTFDV